MSATEERAAIADRLRALLEDDLPVDSGRPVQLDLRSIDAVMTVVGPLLDEAVAERVAAAVELRERSPSEVTRDEVREAVHGAVSRISGPFSGLVDEVVSAVCDLVRDVVADRERLRRELEGVAVVLRANLGEDARPGDRVGDLLTRLLLRHDERGEALDRVRRALRLEPGPSPVRTEREIASCRVRLTRGLEELVTDSVATLETLRAASASEGDDDEEGR